MRIVLDTNILLVIVSQKSKLRWIFEKFLNEDFTLCVTTEILLEYEEILTNHMGQSFAAVIMQIIENAPNVYLITKYFEWHLITADPDDNKFVDCAVAGRAKFIVTHDKHFNVLKEVEFPKIEVINVEEFAKSFS